MLGSSRPELGRKPEGEVPTRTWAGGGPPGGSQAARGCAVSQHVCIGNIGVHRGSVCVYRESVCTYIVCVLPGECLAGGAGPGPDLFLGLF